MNKHILVTYATRAGSTAEVATVIGEVLRARGFDVDVTPVKERPTVEGYQAAVIGSAIRMSNWLPEIVEFVRNNRAPLSRIPAAIFTVPMLNRDGSETSRRARQAYTAPIHQILNPTDEVFFDGRMDYSKLKFLDRAMAKAVEKQTNTKEGDFRDWNKIRGWAQTIFVQEPHDASSEPPF